MSLGENEQLSETMRRELRFAALHEAGHAVVGRMVNKPASFITVWVDEHRRVRGLMMTHPPVSAADERRSADPNEHLDFCTRIETLMNPSASDWLRNELAFHLGGIAACLAVDQQKALRSSRGDLDSAGVLAQSCARGAEKPVHILLAQALRFAAQVCDEQRASILALANRLLVDQYRMEAEAIRDTLAETGFPAPGGPEPDPSDWEQWPSSFMAARTRIWWRG
ncbi:MAG: hypothetical protein JHD07_08890 [Bradyrhizobium sp.]|uniref:hypothetical protein n=1 Tax=Bradyrhizobium sp. TaxID=376 RepID=UPI001A297B7D|nr:hypothetical protein [Bradyrhizobium sp.]MBJ7403394.1 hypothetical protein [Bradyrhizobium sp.]